MARRGWKTVMVGGHLGFQLGYPQPHNCLSCPSGCGTGPASLLRERAERVVYLIACARYTHDMKHLVDVDETLLEQARATLGTNTIKDTVNEALRLAADRKRTELDAAMDELAELVRTLPVQDRASAW